MFHNIPLELRVMKRWCFTGHSEDPVMAKAPHAVIDGSMREVSTVGEDIQHLLTFEDIEPMLSHYTSRGLGYVLCDGDGITCIDLDVKDDSPLTLTERHSFLVKEMNTYTEASQSGCGVHMWLRGEIDGVIKTKDIEVYSRERFIICTGNVMRDLPLADDPTAISFFNSHASKTTDYDQFPDAPETATDAEVVMNCLHHDHTGKFEALYNGTWDAYVDILSGQRNSRWEFNPSEADASFMTIVTFYTKNYEQVKRVWRASALGMLEKRYNNDAKEMQRKRKNHGSEYKLNRVISLSLSRNHQDAMVEEANLNRGRSLAASVIDKEGAKEVALTTQELLPGMNIPSIEGEQDWPPGLMGELAKYYYSSSMKQIKSFAILQAIATCAGVFGRAYNISNTGLNIYMMLLAPSGTGKGALSANPAKFMGYLERERGVINASNYIETQRFTHENAMYSKFTEQSSFCQCLSEFGNVFTQMVKDTGVNKTVRDQMTDVFPKSGAHDTVGGVRYSKSENTLSIPHSIAYSFLGESVPESFYDCISYDMFSDGFISRFLISQYHGDIPYDNPKGDHHVPPKALADRFTEAVCGVSRALQDPHRLDAINVGRDAESGLWFTEFSRRCTDYANTQKENAVWGSLWTRANLKVLKLAGLIAAADNYIKPIVTMEHVHWAVGFILRHNALVLRVVETEGIIGDDVSRVGLIRTCLVEFINNPNQSALSGTSNYHLLKNDGVIPWVYLQRRLSRNKAFNNHKHRTSTQMLKDTVQQSIDLGLITEVTRNVRSEKYRTTALCYSLSDGVLNS